MAGALRAARRSLGHVGFAPPNGAALWQPGLDRVRTAAQKGPAPEWPGRELLASAAKGAEMAFAIEPPPASVDALVAAGIERVVLGGPHPDPEQSGRFTARAREAGIAVTVLDHPRLGSLLEVYEHALRAERAFVVLKAATSIDGRIATRTGESQWITGEAARAEGRRLRADLDAILVGVQTVLADNPKLTARHPGAKDPVRVVLDSKLRTPPEATLVQTADQVPTVIMTTAAGDPVARQRLEAAGTRVVSMPEDSFGRVSVVEATRWLVGEGLPGLLVEGGGAVHGAFMDAGLVDRLVWFGAPILLGGDGRAAVGGVGPAHLAQALRFERWSVRRLGPDWMIDARR